MSLPMTAHASIRRQQRGIPSFIINLLEDYGSSVRCNGADRLIFDKAAIRRLSKHLGGEKNLRTIEPWRRVYAVIGANGSVITVAHTTHRHRRN